MCGHLPDPEHGCGDGDDGALVSGGFLEACGDTSEVLELGEAALDEVPLGVEMAVERVFLGARRVVGNDCQRALGRDVPAQSVAVIGGIGDDDLGGLFVKQALRLRCVASLPGREAEFYRATQGAHGHVDLGAQAAARAAKGLISSPFFAPAACW